MTMNEEQYKSRLIIGAYLGYAIILLATCYDYFLNGHYDLVLSSAIALPALIISACYKFINRNTPHTDYLALPLLVLIGGLILFQVKNYHSLMIMWAHALPVFSFLLLTMSLAVLFNGIFMLLLGIQLYAVMTTDMIVPNLINYALLIAVSWAFAYKISNKQHVLSLLTITDYLTGAYTQKQLYNMLEQEISRSKVTSRPLSIIALDIDQYKQINDIHGHVEGDRLLVSFTQHIRAMIRAGDEIFRYQGTSFILLLPNSTRDGAIVIQERIQRAVANKKWSAIGDISITTAHATLQPEEEAAELIERTNQLLHKMKTTQLKILSGF